MKEVPSITYPQLGRLYSWEHLVNLKFAKFQKKDLCVMLNQSGVIYIGPEQVMTGMYTLEHTIHEVSCFRIITSKWCA